MVKEGCAWDYSCRLQTLSRVTMTGQMMAACHANKEFLCIIVCGTMNNSCMENQAFALISQSYCIKCSLMLLSYLHL